MAAAARYQVSGIAGAAVRCAVHPIMPLAYYRAAGVISKLGDEAPARCVVSGVLGSLIGVHDGTVVLVSSDSSSSPRSSARTRAQ